MLVTCRCCGLPQNLPEVPAGARACCARCETTLRGRAAQARAQGRTAALATAALILYPLAVSLPILVVEKLGSSNATSILEGCVRLFADGHLGIGLIVLVCSVVLPLFKLLSLLVLTTGGGALRKRHRALTYRIVEWTGRYGMLDVLCVALLVAVLKLGDWVAVSAGPGALAFGVCVLLSLLAAASFDPHALWEEPA